MFIVKVTNSLMTVDVYYQDYEFRDGNLIPMTRCAALVKKRNTKYSETDVSLVLGLGEN